MDMRQPSGDSGVGDQSAEASHLCPHQSDLDGSRSTQLATVSLADPIVLVLADAPTSAGVANAKGHLFERFIARLLSIHGYQNPTTENLNVTVDGIELDVTARHMLTGTLALAECKAYSSPVRAELLDAFYGKLMIRRFKDPSAHGFFVALPRLTSSGREQEEAIRQHDPNFSVLNALGIVEALKDRGEISDLRNPIPLASDRAVIISEHGVYSACVELDPKSRTPIRVLVWAPDRPAPLPLLDTLAASDYAQGVAVEDARAGPETRISPDTHSESEPSLIVPVRGSGSDFEYQLPASPRFFVGRKRLIVAFEEALEASRSVIVLNAQSGWGKSSLALRLKHELENRRGHALVVDSRTASSPRFVTEVLRRAASAASEAGLLVLPESASWASLSSALRTLGEADWSGGAPLLVFFDQFENVFRDESLTREFRDLALGVQEYSPKLMIGFAWKTDLVGWTEAHPYRLRDEIRGNAEVLSNYLGLA